MAEILFNKVRDVKSPSKSYDYAAATDFYVPNYNSTFSADLVAKNPNKYDYKIDISQKLDGMTITLMPHGRINIPSGIRVVISDPRTCLLAVNKSGISTKKGIVLSACLVDADYRGEIHLGIINSSNEPVQIKSGDKLVQFMYLPVLNPNFTEIDSVKFESFPNTARGSCGFGSSDNT